MVEEIAFENGRISNSEGIVTLTLDRVILHNVVHSSISTYTANFIEIKETFCGRMDACMYRKIFFWSPDSSVGGKGYPSPHLTPTKPSRFTMRPQNSIQVYTPALKVTQGHWNSLYSLGHISLLISGL